MYAVPSSSAIAAATSSASSRRELAVARVLDLAEDEPVSRRDAPPRARLGPLEPPLVVRLGREGGDLRPQAPGVLEEDPALGRHRPLVAEQVLEHRHLRLLRLRALRDLRELVRVAEEDEVARRVTDRERVGERDLARLVHEERVEEAVEVRRTKSQRRARDELELRVEQVLPAVRGVDEAALEARLLVSARRLLAAVEREALLARLALDLAEELVDRLVAERGDADALAGLR